MRDSEIINHPDMDVILRKDFYDNFESPLKKITEDTGATYYGHNIIKNYREKGHRISTFCNHEVWHNLYWQKYYNSDPIEKMCHQASQKHNFMVISWGVLDQLNSCLQERMDVIKIKDGVIFSFKRPEKYIETFHIEWENLNTDCLDINYILHLTSLLQPLRNYHWEVHDRI